MNLQELLKGVDVLNNIDNIIENDISSLEFNSKSQMKNALFFCYNGVNRDSHDYVKEAVKNGAEIFVVEKPIDKNYKQVLVHNARSAMSLIASNFYGCPSKKMKIIGITGTNGKTTTSHFLAHILARSGKKVGLIGTEGNYINGVSVGKSLTTPDPIELQGLFAEMVSKGVSHCVVEVSAHSLALSKLDGIKFEIGALTNITQDHLDFFETFENYEQCKMSFFDKKHVRLGVLNSDDMAGDKIVKTCNIPTVSYGIETPCDVFAVDMSLKIDGSEYVVNLLDEIYIIKTRLVGKFNVYNALTAITCAKMLGLSKCEIVNAVSSFKPPEGRFSLQKTNKCFVVIDYAHTPDGMENVLKTLKDACDGKIICVFGCGGNRDKNKRAKMARVAEKYSDFTVLSSDNPRYEDPNDIAMDVEKGFSKSNYITILDRGLAIEYAIGFAQKNDVVAILGKGAENYIEIRGEKIPYSDFEMVEKIMTVTK